MAFGLGCCSEPLLCIKTLFFPCGTFSRIATVATSRHISSAEACNKMTAYSLILSCCCYNCCIRRKLRKKLNITGGLCDDFLSHLTCYSCSRVSGSGDSRHTCPERTKTSTPPSQYMEAQSDAREEYDSWLDIKHVEVPTGVMVGYHCCIPPKIGILWVIYLPFCDQILTFFWL